MRRTASLKPCARQPKGREGTELPSKLQEAPPAAAPRDSHTQRLPRMLLPGSAKGHSHIAAPEDLSSLWPRQGTLTQRLLRDGPPCGSAKGPHTQRSRGMVLPMAVPRGPLTQQLLTDGPPC